MSMVIEVGPEDDEFSGYCLALHPVGVCAWSASTLDEAVQRGTELVDSFLEDLDDEARRLIRTERSPQIRIVRAGSDPIPDDVDSPAGLRLIRERNGWTQADFARHLGVEPLTVSRWERGASTPRGQAVRGRIRQLAGTVHCPTCGGSGAAFPDPLPRNELQPSSDLERRPTR